MSRTGIFCIFMAISVQVKAASQGYKCVTDYWYTISCSLKIPDTSSRNIYWLEAHLKNKNQTYDCQLQRVHENHICSFTVQSYFKNVDKFSMTLHYSENGTMNSSLLEPFEPAKNIKPNTPFNLTLQHVNGTYHFFWISGYENHMYREALPIKYKFKYYKDRDREVDFKEVEIDKEMIQIDEMQFDLDTMYTVMVKTKIDVTIEYNGAWSDWSSAVQWKTARRDESSEVSKIVFGMFAVVGFLILIMSIPAARFKMKEMSWVPTPAAYFQPLYQNYEGNFQGWVLAKSPLQDFQVIEDFSKIDKISEVLTTLQYPAEKTGMYPTTQCHTPYVGPTAEVWVPCQMPDMCSETSIPCEEFSLFCEELPDKVDNLFQSLNLACLSGDVLSLKDLALSLECLEDCEVSEAPVIINPVPACFRQDYCTLTNTPTGPVPTFTRDVEQDENTSTD